MAKVLGVEIPSFGGKKEADIVAETPAVAKQPTEEPIKVERKVEQLNPIRMKEGQYERTVWVITAHENTYPQDFTDPAYWSHVASKLRPWDRIEARANDGTWYAELIVLEAGRNWARVQLLSAISLTTADIAMTQSNKLSAYEIVFRGPHSQWSVIRKADREVVHEGETTQGGAVNWLNERMKAGG